MRESSKGGNKEKSVEGRKNQTKREKEKRRKKRRD